MTGDLSSYELPLAPFRVRLSDAIAYWSAFDASYRPVEVVDSFLREVRFGRDLAERTTQMYTGALCRFLNWSAERGWDLERAAKR